MRSPQGKRGDQYCWRRLETVCARVALREGKSPHSMYISMGEGNNNIGNIWTKILLDVTPRKVMGYVV